MSLKSRDNRTKLVHLPINGETRLVASHVAPTIANHLPFEWVNLKRLQGKVVSVKLRAGDSGFTVVSIATNND